MSDPSPVAAVRLVDYHPPPADMRAEVLQGLSRRRKALSPKYFYDARGSRLFERITRLPEYYLTRTERSIMAAGMGQMADAIGPGAAVIEFGSGSSTKIRYLLDHLRSPAAYVPVDISRSHLLRAAESLAADHPGLDIVAVCADFTRPFDLPPLAAARRRLVFFPGSTIGNLTHDESVQLLRVMNHVAGANGALLIGVDMVKDTAALEAAYNDAAGVTAAFNLNLLERINHELRADFDTHAFRHRAVYNAAAGRIEMYLVSQSAQRVRLAGREIRFAAGESILTEYSHKYTQAQFAELAARGGFVIRHQWTDAQGWFSVQFLERADAYCPEA